MYAPVPDTFRSIEHFAQADRERLPGHQLGAIREAAESFRSWFRGLGTCEGVRTCDLIALPYPRRFALWRATPAPNPFIRIFNRMMVVQWSDPDGKRRTLLVEPTEYDLAANTPFFAELARKTPWLRPITVKAVASVREHLDQLGIAPEDVDYITYDHLHTQDLRLWLGTTRPQPDLEVRKLVPAGEPVRPWLPNARLLVMREEWEMIEALHPVQRAWYQPDTFRDIPRDRVVLLDGDTLLGPGVALLKTPGHSMGNHSVVLNTSTGIWTQSENGVHAECYTPERSRIPGLARYARETGLEVVLNANTIEMTAVQYNSMVKEKLVADRGGPGGEWVQHFSSSEMTPWALSPGLSPSFTYKAITHGELNTTSVRQAA